MQSTQLRIQRLTVCRKLTKVNPLKMAPIKAEALRPAQIAMIQGQVRIEGGQLRRTVRSGSIPLPSELKQIGDKELSHPYYWSGFTMIGNPW